MKDPTRLVVVLQKDALWKMPHGHSWLDFQEYRQRVEAFEDVIATMMTPVHLSAPGEAPERAWVEATSGNYFSMLGIEAAYGRVFRKGEGEHLGADPVLVLSHRFWMRRFGGDRSIIGKTIHLNGHPFTVIGVTPEKFQSAQWSIAINAFVPATMLGRLRVGGEKLLEERGSPAFKTFARLKPGVTLAQARTAVDLVGRSLAKEYPQEHKDAKVFVVPEQHSRPEPTFSEFMPLVRSIFTVMMGLVLLIACANVANLMFSRAVIRQKEMGIRIAIGGTRWRLIRQLLAESVLLAVMAGGVGMLFAFWAGYFLSGFSPTGDIPIRTEQSWDWRIPAFTFLISLAAGVITGIVPALRATKVDVQATIKEGGATMLGSKRHAFRSFLVISQVAISLVVLVAGGLFVRTLQRAARLELGFRPDHLLMASLDLGLQGYDDRRGKQFCQQLLEKVRALPEVRSATLATTVPFDYGFDIASIATEGKASNDEESFSAVHWSRVGQDYLKAMGVALQRGRDFTEQDNEKAPKVAIINAAMAARFWAGTDPIGKRFRRQRNGELWQVIGVVPTGKYVMLGEEPRPFFYVPLAQEYSSPVTLHVRMASDTAAVLTRVREVLRELDPHLPIYNVRKMEEHLRESAFALMPLRMGATLAGMQGLLGLILAMMGIYGVVAYVVSWRTREIGIRIALGAQKFTVLRLVVQDGVKLILIGTILGGAGGLVLTQVLAKVLHGLTPAVMPVFVLAVLLLFGVGALACYLPARRATQVDPVTALRAE